MESSGQRPTDPEVPLADATIATEIAHAAARGRGADRAPTLEQLLAAFGESAPTPAARARVAAALRVAGMGVKPDLAGAEPGQRLVLLPPGVSEGRSRGRAMLGLIGVALVLVAAAAGASLLENKDNDDDKLSSLPATTAAPATTATAPVTTPSVTGTTATPTTVTGEVGGTATTPTTTTSADEQAAADERRRKRAARLKRQREAAAKAKKQRAAAAAKLVTVRVDASGRPTFLCVDDGSGKTLFSGTLDGKKVFKAKRVRMNIGLKSTFVTVNGNPVPLDGSPAGLDITRAGGAKALGLGKRPCG